MSQNHPNEAILKWLRCVHFPIVHVHKKGVKYHFVRTSSTLLRFLKPRVVSSKHLSITSIPLHEHFTNLGLLVTVNLTIDVLADSSTTFYVSLGISSHITFSNKMNKLNEVDSQFHLQQF